jgi:hypothetical protein
MAQLSGLSKINSPSGRGNLALGYLLQESPFLAYLESQSAFEEGSTSFRYNVLADIAAAAAARAIGGSWTTSDKTPPSDQTGSLRIHGGSIDIDRSHMADAENGVLNIDKWLEKLGVKQMRSFAQGYEGKLFNSDGSSNSIYGLTTILDGTTDIPGFTGVKGVANAAEYTAATDDSMDLTNSTAQGEFIEMMELLLAQVSNPTAIVVNPSLAARISTIARVKHIIGESRDLFGRPISTYAGIPIVKVLATSILNTEEDDNATPLTNTTSLYIMSPGEMRTSLVTNSGLEWNDYGTLEGKESYREKWEIRASWKIEESNSILRVRNLKV